MISRNTIPVAAFAMFSIFFTDHREVVASIVYDFPSQQGLGGDWSLDGGSITTDGTIGEIGPQNFLEWSIRFSSPLGQYEISSDNGAALLVIFSGVTTSIARPFFDTTPGSPYFVNGLSTYPIVRPSLRATPDQIFASPESAGFLMLFFSSEDILSSTFSGQAVSFSPSLGILGPNNRAGAYFRLIDNNRDASRPYGPFRPIDPGPLLPPSLDPVGFGPNPNFSPVRTTSGPMVLASVRSVPEPTASLFLLMPSVVIVGNRRRKSKRRSSAS